MEVTKVITGGILIILGLVLLPVVAVFIAHAKHNQSLTGYVNSSRPNAGLSGSILDLVGYGFAFGLVGIGVGMIYMGFKA